MQWQGSQDYRVNPEHRNALSKLGLTIKGIKYSYPDDPDFALYGITESGETELPVDVQISATFESSEAIARLQENLIILDAAARSDNIAVQKTLQDLRIMLGLTKEDNE